ncbi:MAG: hypothetical protein RL176_611 [Pseudomonadota bacterium]|jgi:hypothetical protein
MSKQKKENDEFNLAMYLLKNRFNSPMDLVRYWAFTGPCIEPHPFIEDYSKRG